MTAGTDPVPSGARREELTALAAGTGKLVLDLGCGNGAFLAALARREPEWRVVGVEKKEYRVRQTRRRIAELENATVLHGDVVEVLRELPPASVERIYLLFNDPWPKRRHAVRRLVQREFAELLRTRLEPRGRIYFATDAEEYFVWSRDLLGCLGWRLEDWVVGESWPRTEFETRFVERGLMVYRFQANFA